MKKIFEKVFTNFVILNEAKNLKSAPSLTTSHKRYSIVCSAESQGEGKGFTLAEVLITLGVIGVVAALTIPSLIENHNKRVVETRLKKFYTSINEAIRLSEIDNGPKETWAPRNTEEFLEKYILNYLKCKRNKKSTNLGSSNNYWLVYLSDGSAFLVDIYHNTNGGHFIFCPGARYCEEGGDYEKFGRSQFMFAYWPNGSNSFKYHKNKGVEPYLNMWNGREESLYKHAEFGCYESARDNRYCTAIIQRNGWKIPDDYPYKVRY